MRVVNLLRFGLCVLSFIFAGYAFAVPSAPSGVDASDGTYSSYIRIEWNSVSGSGSVSYEVSRATSSNGSKSVIRSWSSTRYYNWYSGSSATKYWFFVRARDSTGEGNYSQSDEGWEEFDPPSNLDASDGTNTSRVELDWGSVSGASQYRVARATSQNGSKTELGSWSSSRSYNDTNASAGVVYYYFVKARSGSSSNDVESDYSAYETGYRALEGPSNFDATDGTETNGVDLSWSSLSGASQYRCGRATSSSGSISELGSWSSSRSYTDTSATIGQIYYYYVKARSSSSNGYAEGEWSTVDTGHRGIAAPSSVQASDGTNQSAVEITWGSVSYADDYRVYRATSSSSSATRTAISNWQSSRSFNDTTATPGTTYYYFVRAKKDAAESDFSNYNTGYIGTSPPTNVVASDGTSTSGVDITWDAVSSANSYAVYRATSQSGSKSTVRSWSSTRSYTDTSATPGEIYYYFVKARDGSNESDFSQPDTGYRALEAPSNVDASDGTNTSRVEITWSAVTGADSYQVYRASSQNGSYSSVGSWSSSRSYNDSSASVGNRYWYRVVARAGSGSSAIESAESTPDEGWRGIEAPSNVDASDGTYTNRVEITFSSVSGASQYRVFRATTQNGSATAIGSWSSSRSVDDTSATPGQVYYYEVVARTSSSSSAIESPASQRDSGYIGAAPGTPNPTSPTNGAQGQGTSVTLYWSAATGSPTITYQVQVDVINTFPSPIFDQSNITQTSVAVSNLQASTTYYWRVRASNAQGTGNWSTVYSFTTAGANTPPGAVTLTSPSDSAAVLGPDVALSWSSTTGSSPLTYDVQVSTSMSMSPLLIDQTGLSTPAFTATGLSNGVTYYWRARAVNPSGNGAWSAIRSFTVNASLSAPSIVTLLAPSDMAMGVGTGVTLTWDAASGSPTITYNLQVATDALLNTLIHDRNGIANTSAGVPGLLDNTTYYWRVSAENSAGRGQWSNTWSFTTAASGTAPGAVTLQSPSDGASAVGAASLMLRWDPASGSSPMTYDVEVATDMSFANIAASLSGLIATGVNPMNLSDGTTYYWRVRGDNPIGTGAWSSVWSFTTASPLTLVQGIRASVSDSRPLVITPESGHWNAVSLATPASAEWTLSMGSALAGNTASRTDFVIANGNLGTISPNGSATLTQGTGDARLAHVRRASILPGGGAGTADFSGEHNIFIFELQIGTTGVHDVTLTPNAGAMGVYSWWAFAPGASSAWRSPANASFGPYASGTRAVNFAAGGVWCIVVALEDGATASEMVDLEVQTNSGGANPLAIVNASVDLARGVVDLRYTGVSVMAQGGTQPYTFSLSNGSSLPNGLSLSTTSGAISGTPSVEGSFTFDVTLRDAQGAQVQASFRIVIEAPSVIANPDNVPSSTSGGGCALGERQDFAWLLALLLATASIVWRRRTGVSSAS